MQTEFLRPPVLLKRERRLTALVLDLRRLWAVAVACVRVIGFRMPIRRRARVHTTRAERVRIELERLGLTYLKLGQFLAMRFDLLPREVCDELEKLYERVDPVPFPAVRELIESEFDAPLDTLFSSFSETPLASASVAQVHVATTAAGEPVAVKVQRPGIEHAFRADMRNLWRLARLLDRLGVGGELSVREIAHEFITWTAGELDFISEARTADRVRSNALEYEIVPELHWDLITSRVLTMELIDGLSLNTVTEIIAEGGEELLAEHLPGIDIGLTLRRLATASLRQIFITGFFHGDPHPGNILIRADNTVVFVDFGIFGELNRWHRQLMVAMVESIALGDVDRAFRSYAAISDLTEGTDAVAFEQNAKAVLRRWYSNASDEGSDKAERHLGKYVAEMLDLVRRHRVRLRFDTLLFWRTLHALDASGLKFPLHFDLLAELRYFFTTRAGSTPGNRFREVVDDPDHRLTVLRLRREAPAQLRVLSAIGDGSVPVRPDKDEDRRTRHRRNGMAKALSAAALAASSALLATSAAVVGGLQIATAALTPALAIMALRSARA
jgi:ubiquinone biosynthesis protein